MDEFILFLQITADDRLIVSASNDCTIRVWQVTGKELLSLEGHSDAVSCLALMSNGYHVVSGSKDKTVRVWNLETGSCDHVFEGHSGVVGCVAVTMDSHVILSGSGDFTLKVWSVLGRECLHTLRGYNDTIKCIGITTDQRYVIAGSHEGKDQLRMWSIKSGECVRVLHGHVHAVMNLTMLSRDHMMITSSRDGTLKVWGVATGDLIDSFDFQSQVKHFAVSPAGTDYSVIAVTKSGTVSILELNIPRESKQFQLLKKGSKEGMATETEHEPTRESGKCSTCCKCCTKCALI